MFVGKCQAYDAFCDFTGSTELLAVAAFLTGDRTAVLLIVLDAGG